MYLFFGPVCFESLSLTSLVSLYTFTLSMSSIVSSKPCHPGVMGKTLTWDIFEENKSYYLKVYYFKPSLIIHCYEIKTIVCYCLIGYSVNRVFECFLVIVFKSYVSYVCFLHNLCDFYYGTHNISLDTCFQVIIQQCAITFWWQFMTCDFLWCGIFSVCNCLRKGVGAKLYVVSFSFL